jgi:sporulation protein YlmC with PRC-barrel domain
MIAAELRGGGKPSLNEALGWIGSRVDDIYGAGVGRIEDVWIDPGTGAPRWLLVKEGRFGGRSTLIPFEDATAGAGHVWVPYERDVVREAPEVQPGAPLTQELETALRAHYSATAPRSATRPPASAGSEEAGATIRFGGRAGERSESFAGEAPVGREAAAEPERAAVPFAAPPPRMPERPAPPVEAPRRREAARPDSPPGPPPEHAEPSPRREPDPFRYRREDEELVYRPAPERHDPYGYAQALEQDPYRYAPPPRAERPAPPAADPAQEHIDALRDLAAAGGTHFVEIELSGELSIRGELRSIRVTPHERRPPAR